MAGDGDAKQVKIMLVGEAGCGKSALLVRWCDETFRDPLDATMGLDFNKRTIELDQRMIKVQLWDTAGDKRFRSTKNSFYRAMDAVLIVYDVCDRDSFAQIPNWLTMIEESANKEVVYHIVAAKSDTAQPAVSLEEGRAFAESLGLHFTACSAKTDSNIAELFNDTICAVNAARVPTELVVTVMASSDSQNGSVTLTGLSLSGTDLGACYVEATDVPCVDVVPQLRDAFAIQANHLAQFVTREGFVIPGKAVTEYEQETAELVWVCASKDVDKCSQEEQIEAIFSAAGLCIDDVDEDPELTDAEGKPFDQDDFDEDCGLTDPDVDVEEVVFPVSFKFTVKRRKKPITVAEAFKLDCQG